MARLCFIWAVLHSKTSTGSQRDPVRNGASSFTFSLDGPCLPIGTSKRSWFNVNIPYTTEKLASFPTVNPAFLLPFHFTQSFEKSGKGHKLYSYVLSTKTIVAISATLSYIPQSDHGSIFFLPMVVTTVLEKKNAWPKLHEGTLEPFCERLTPRLLA